MAGEQQNSTQRQKTASDSNRTDIVLKERKTDRLVFAVQHHS